MLSFKLLSFDFLLKEILTLKPLQFYLFIFFTMLSFQHNEITVYILLTFMTFVPLFHWYWDNFPSQYLSTGRLSHVLALIFSHCIVFSFLIVLQFYLR